MAYSIVMTTQITFEMKSIEKEMTKYSCIVERNEAYCPEDGASQQPPNKIDTPNKIS